MQKFIFFVFRSICKIFAFFDFPLELFGKMIYNIAMDAKKVKNIKKE